MTNHISIKVQIRLARGAIVTQDNETTIGRFVQNRLHVVVDSTNCVLYGAFNTIVGGF